MQDTWTLSVVGLGCFAAALLLLQGPLTCVSLLVGFAFFGWKPIVLSWRDIDLQAGDLLYGLTVVALMFGSRRSTRGAEPSASGAAADSTPAFAALLPVLIVTALGVLRVGQRQPELFESSLVSWIRLAQTISLAWLVPRVVSTRPQLDRLLLACDLGALTSVLLALGRAALWGNILGNAGRVRGFGDPNSLGLVAGYLLARAFFQRDRSLDVRILLGACGVAGLVGSRSVSSIFATGLACVIGLVIERRPYVPLALRRGLLSAAAAVGAITAVVVLRPEVTPSNASFWRTSAAERIIVAAAAIELFRQHPFVGVGWQASTPASGVSSHEIMQTLRARFRMANPNFFRPRVVTAHNAYLQVLAELGLLGLAGFALTGVKLVRRTRGLIAKARGTPLEVPVIGLVSMSTLVLIWLNQNPIFGGQVETQALALFLGSLTVLARSVPHQPKANEEPVRRWA